MVLSGLRHVLHGVHAQWDMHFVESADAALKAVDQRPEVGFENSKSGSRQLVQFETPTRVGLSDSPKQRE